MKKCEENIMKILILSRNDELYSTRRLVEAARKLGHSAEVMDYLKCSVFIEKGNPIINCDGRIISNGRFEGETDGEIHAIIPRIGASKTFYGSAVVRQFEMMKVFTAAKSIAIVRSRDKLRTLQILSKAGIGLPKTVFTSNPDNIKNLISLVDGPPVIIKVLEGTQGIGVVLAESIKAARSVIEAFDGLKVNILIQEFIKESDGADIRAFVVEGKVVAAMKRQCTQEEFRSNIHRGGAAGKISLTIEEKNVAIGAAKAMGLSVAGVDLLRSNRGPLVIEVNSSPGLEGIETFTKVNVAEKIIRFIGKNVHKRKQMMDKVGA
jgi:ribosomal protein S6--L-glutamate ligase